MKTTGLAAAMQYVSDPEASVQWYSDLLGIGVTPFPLPMFEWGDGARLMLAPSAPGTGRGGTSVWFQVDDVRATYDEARSQGYAFNEEPQETPDGSFVSLNDPDGNIVGFMDLPAASG